ncbi:hypothetical protein [Halomonas cerina]|uniref:Putative RNA-binding Zn-ribbon protein involved in translation (DUF1610 family) n=1 Tax=Halomonas cerina TaxID=447424 RepID=A0A839V911_9GAMM|nr:hypothetical protein [Halomonas cerina]MBB3189217.1 putative RNA-binding Zn-ribbon protein involved in translation (DUF1610 family) [Halomonas cerina]
MTIQLDERVTGAALMRFLRERGVADSCPMCGTHMSTSVHDPAGVLEDEAPAVRVIHVMDDGSRRGYGEFLRVCPSCGFIHYIRDIEVLAYLDEEGDNG